MRPCVREYDCRGPSSKRAVSPLFVEVLEVIGDQIYVLRKRFRTRSRTPPHTSDSTTGVRRTRYPSPSSAPQHDEESRRFVVTHPYHPLCGQEFEVLTYRNAWGEDRVYFYDAKGHPTNIPASWTDCVAPDPFVVVSAGRSCFRLIDLLELRSLLNSLADPRAAECKAKSVTL